MSYIKDALTASYSDVSSPRSIFNTKPLALAMNKGAKDASYKAYMDYLVDLENASTAEEKSAVFKGASKEVKEFIVRSESLFYRPFVFFQKLKFFALGNTVLGKKISEENLKDMVISHPVVFDGKDGRSARIKYKKNNEIISKEFTDFKETDEYKEICKSIKDKNPKIKEFEINKAALENFRSKYEVSKTEFDDFTWGDWVLFGIRTAFRNALAMTFNVLELAALGLAKMGNLIPISVLKPINVITNYVLLMKPIGWLIDKVVSPAVQFVSSVAYGALGLLSYVVLKPVSMLFRKRDFYAVKRFEEWSAKTLPEMGKAIDSAISAALWPVGAALWLVAKPVSLIARGLGFIKEDFKPIKSFESWTKKIASSFGNFLKNTASSIANDFNDAFGKSNLEAQSIALESVGDKKAAKLKANQDPELEPLLGSKVAVSSPAPQNAAVSTKKVNAALAQTPEEKQPLLGAPDPVQPVQNNAAQPVSSSAAMLAALNGGVPASHSVNVPPSSYNKPLPTPPKKPVAAPQPQAAAPSVNPQPVPVSVAPQPQAAAPSVNPQPAPVSVAPKPVLPVVVLHPKPVPKPVNFKKAPAPVSKVAAAIATWEASDKASKTFLKGQSLARLQSALEDSKASKYGMFAPCNERGKNIPSPSRRLGIKS